MSPLDTPIARRTVLKGFLIAGPTLAIAARLDFADRAGAFPAQTNEVANFQDFTDIFVTSEEPFVYDILIKIKPDNRVYVEGPRQDIGQGFATMIGMTVADGLDVAFENMDIVLSDAKESLQTAQLTGGSHNTRVLWDPVRVITARMRGQLMAAASKRLGVPVTSLRTEDGHVVATDGRRVSYAEISAEAAQMPPAPAKPKNPSEFKIIGKPRIKYGAEKIAQGTFRYNTDLFSSKEFLPTVVALGATFGSSVVSIDDSEAKKIPGFIAVTHIPGMPEYLIPEAVAVTAETTGIAKKIKNKLRIKWSAGPLDSLSDAQIDDVLNGIIDKIVSPGEGIEGVFRWPYVPHAPMQENAALARVEADRAEIWSCDQVPNVGRRHVAETLGMKIDQVTYHVIPAGGAFGRHLFHDQEVMAAQIAQRLNKPVKLQWLREEGIKWGRTRPTSIHHVKATIANGDVVAWEHRMACPELDLRHGLGDAITGYVTEYNNEGASQYFFTHTNRLIYKTGPTAITLKQRLLAKPTAAWRTVYTGQVHVIDEILIDEVARSLGKDEFEFRMEYLDSDRQRAVLEKVAHEGQWGRKLPAGVAQGLGMHDQYKSIVACLIEIDTRGKEPRMTRAIAAVDNGFCVNPSATKGAVLGSIHDGFSVVFRAGLHVDSGATRESNFHDYKWSRMFDSPREIEVFILPNSNSVPGGMGETAHPAAAAACANAWARATGKKPRNFPLNEYGA
jgi:isoquinoline 1-oxidoreductase beta subunit